MALKTSFRYRRLQKSQAKVKLKFITFSLANHWFALSIKEAVKVILAQEIEENFQQNKLNIIKYKNQEILVIDLATLFFPEQAKPELNQINDLNKIKYFVFVQNKEQQIVAFPIYSTPTLLMCEESALKPLPKNYFKSDNLQSLSLNMIEIPDRPSLFLLEPELLLTLPELNI
jgi:chemotaxis signal transduction protein